MITDRQQEHASMEAPNRTERIARAILVLAAVSVVCSGFLPWDHSYGRTQTGLGFGLVAWVMGLAGLSLLAGLKRWYLPAAALTIPSGFIVFWFVVFATGGFFGTQPQPQNVGIGALLAFWGLAGIAGAGVVAWGARLRSALAVGGLGLGAVVVINCLSVETPWVTPVWGVIGLALVAVAGAHHFPFLRAVGLVVLAASALSMVMEIFGARAYILPLHALAIGSLVVETGCLYAAGYLHVNRAESHAKLTGFDACFDEFIEIGAGVLTLLSLSLGAFTILGPNVVGTTRVGLVNASLLAACATVLLAIGVLKGRRRTRLIALGIYANALIGSWGYISSPLSGTRAVLILAAALLICFQINRRLVALPRGPMAL